jgi:hypothetical protein
MISAPVFFGCTDHQLQPVLRGDFVVTDHQEMRRNRKARLRGFKGGVDGVAISLPRFDYAQTGKFVGPEEFGGNRYAAAFRGVVFDHHHGEAADSVLFRK